MDLMSVSGGFQTPSRGSDGVSGALQEVPGGSLWPQECFKGSQRVPGEIYEVTGRFKVSGDLMRILGGLRSTSNCFK